MNSVNELVRSIQGYGIALEKSQVLTVIEVLDKFFSKTKFDRNFSKALYHFQIGYVNTSKDYVDFFGSNLLGVHVIRFREADVLRFFNEVIQIDYDELEQSIRACDTINHTYKVSGDIFNLTVMYVIHRCLAETSLNEKDRYEMAHQAALIFFYRALAAILSAYFTYPADPKTSQAAYANLSFKYLIKRLGSWHKVMDYRAKELIAKNGTQFKKLRDLDKDLDLVDVINDCANAIKDIVKNYYAEFDKAHRGNDRVGVSQSTGLDMEGNEVVKDKIRSVDNYLHLARQYLMEPSAFIRDDYIRVVSDINRNTSPRLLKETLLWMTSHASGKDYKLIDDTVSSIIIYSFYLIDTRMETERTKDVGYVLLQLKNLYLSSRSTDPDLMRIRDMCDKLLGKAHKGISTPLMLATRSALILYVFFRVFVGNRSR